MFAFVAITLGILINVLVMATLRRSVHPKYTRVCQTCGYQVPPMERPPTFHDCPGCMRLYDPT